MYIWVSCIRSFIHQDEALICEWILCGFLYRQYHWEVDSSDWQQEVMVNVKTGLFGQIKVLIWICGPDEQIFYEQV